MKRLVARALWRTVHHGGLAALARRRHRRRLLVVTYHGVLRRVDDDFLNRNCVSVEGFRRQVAYLRRHHRLLTLAQALEAVAEGAIPDGAALITFDDGFRNNHDLALPVLREAGAPAVVFVATGMLDEPGSIPWVEEVSLLLLRGTATRLRLRSASASFDLELDSPGSRRAASDRVRGYMKLAPSAERSALLEQLRHQSPAPPGAVSPERFAFMSWDEARALAASDVAIGSHTVRHLCLASLSEDELRQEVLGSKRRIEEQIGGPCLALAYPDGTARTFGERDQRALEAAGFRGAFSQIPGHNAPGVPRFALRRFNVPGGAADLSTFVATVSGARDLARRVGL